MASNFVFIVYFSDDMQIIPREYTNTQTKKP